MWTDAQWCTRSKLNVGACAITQAISAGPWLRLQLSDSWVGAGPDSDPLLDSLHHHSVISKPHLQVPSCFPDEIECYIFLLAATNSESLAAGQPFPAAAHCCCHHYLLVAKCMHHWLEPMLYKTAVKVLHLHPAIHHAQGVEILQLCQGLQELSLQIVVNLPCDQNPLYEPLSALQLKTLSMDLASSFYGPTIFVPDLHLLCHIEHLHLTNTWVARHGLFISLQELHQLSHLSFHVHPPGQESIDTEIILEVLRQFSRLCVVILWWMEYQESQEIYNHLDKHDLTDHRIIVFNAMHFVECATPVNSFWGLAESIV
ncbi:hypothetical protein BKA82DRAFT_4015815 [Pisolithus tinctorius]|nr:hypothetical protein BKA82DRAFT_4015815 [Pisolithus tinctorius]